MDTRRRSSRKYKQEAVQMVTRRGVTVAQASRDLGLNPNVLRKWVHEQRADPEHAFPGEGQQRPELLASAREHIQNLVHTGIRDRDVGRVSGGPVAMDRVSRKLRARINRYDLARLFSE
jgi:transposase-like protein